MARKRGARADTHAGAHAGAQSDEVELLEADEVPDALRLLVEGEGAKLMIHRAPTKENPDKVHCGTVPALDYEGLIDHLRGLGGGKFSVRPMRGSRWAGPQFTLQVEPPARASSPASAAPSTDMPTVWALMQAQQARTDQMLMALITKGGAGGGAGLSFTDVIAAAKMMKGGGEGSPLAQVKEMLEVSKLLQGDKPETGATDADLILAAITNIATPIAAHLMAERQQGALPAPATAPAAPGAQPAPAAAKVHPLQKLIARVLKEVQAGTDPGRVAAWAVMTMGEDSARALLAQPDPLAALGKVAPAALPVVQAHGEWFAEFLDEVRKELDTDEVGGEGEQ